MRKAALTSTIFLFSACVSAGHVLYNGILPRNYTAASLDADLAPYTTVVKGSEAASVYDTILPVTHLSTPLWLPTFPNDRSINIAISNTSLFVPGNNVANTQYGFRRTELIAQSANRSAFEVGTTVFHVSLQEDLAHPLNYTHEYQIVFIEPSDGSHVFEIQLGTPFTIPSATKPDSTARNLKVRNHALDLVFQTQLLPLLWHNFAVQVDWDHQTLAVLFSYGAAPLKPVTGLINNNSTTPGAAGQGDYHWGVLKLPLADPSETAAEQADVVHYGIQEVTTEALAYSGVFVEDVVGGISVGYGLTIPHIA
ncbi:hypothetical protein DL93DRAFT_2162035 [Clavulina sp. PMI_390]|nr:hypothetical protein DL93DRAFT_2162035 [Clavulina sp. PMI_390]